MHVRIKDHPHLVRSGPGIISTDSEAYLNAKKRKQAELDKKKESNTLVELDQRITKIEDKLDLLLKILQGKQS